MSGAQISFLRSLTVASRHLCHISVCPATSSCHPERVHAHTDGVKDLPSASVSVVIPNARSESRDLHFRLLACRQGMTSVMP